MLYRQLTDAQANLQRLNPFAQHASLDFLQHNCFPPQMCSREADASECQDLVAVGTRHWGNWWDGRGLLRIKLYDFAVYLNQGQAGVCP